MPGKIDWKNQPSKIKGVRELEPGFTPRWLRFELYLVAAFVVILVGSLLASAVFETAALVALIVWGLAAVFMMLALLQFGSALLKMAGRFFPRLTLWAIRWDTWLERDLDWSPQSQWVFWKPSKNTRGVDGGK